MCALVLLGTAFHKSSSLYIVTELKQRSSESYIQKLYRVRPLININTMDQVELETLPGIGPSLAQRIIDFREQSEFTSREDIIRVKGIGPSKFAKIRPLITI